MPARPAYDCRGRRDECGIGPLPPHGSGSALPGRLLRVALRGRQAAGAARRGQLTAGHGRPPARAPFGGAVPLQGGGQLAVVRGSVGGQAAIDVFDLAAQVAQAGLAGQPVGRGEEAGQGRRRRGGDRLAVLRQDRAPVPGQELQPVQQQDARGTAHRHGHAGRHLPRDHAASPPKRAPGRRRSR